MTPASSHNHPVKPDVHPGSRADVDQQLARKLPSPSRSPQDSEHTSNKNRKRKRSSSPSHTASHTSAEPLLRPRKHRTEPPPEISSNKAQHIAVWAATQTWPESYFMAESSSSTSSKRKRSGSQSSNLRQALNTLNENGVFAENLLPSLHPADVELLTLLRKETRDAIVSTSFPPDQSHIVFTHAQSRNESRVQRDVLPWVVPAPSLLARNGVPGMDVLDEEINQIWTDCISLGQTLPKPDFTVGLSAVAFTKDELAKIRNYTTADRPSFVTPNLSYPFLVCECKSHKASLTSGDVQNLNSAAIAIHALFALYEHVYGANAQEIKRDLLGRVLVFSVSHDHDTIKLYAHYALENESNPASRKYYRHHICNTSLMADNGRQRLTAYNFVCNVFDEFTMLHMQRIRTALAHLPEGAAVMQAEIGGSDMEVPSSLGSEEASQSSDGSPGQRARRKVDPSSAVDAVMRQQMDRQMKQLKELRDQMQQQHEDSKRQEQQLRDQMQQQHEDSKRREQQLRDQMQQQREDSKRREQQWQEDRQFQKELMQQLQEQLQRQSELLQEAISKRKS